jgi:uncharacterized protein DUF6529
VEDLVESISRGNVAQVKTVLTAIVTILAVYQVTMMAVGFGWVKVSFLKPRAAATAHRSVGDAIVPITLLVGWMCYAYFGFGDGPEHAFDDETTRATIHAWAGAALIGVLALKIAAVRWWHALDRYLPQFGITVFALFVVTFVTSAGDYLMRG